MADEKARAAKSSYVHHATTAVLHGSRAASPEERWLVRKLGMLLAAAMEGRRLC